LCIGSNTELLGLGGVLGRRRMSDREDEFTGAVVHTSIRVEVFSIRVHAAGDLLTS
jgi:hypothetical protein